MKSNRIRNTILPIMLSLFALLVLNIGLYTRLSATPLPDDDITLTLPYGDGFETEDILSYPQFGGDWDIRDETYVQISTTGSDLGTLIPVNIAREQAYIMTVDTRYLAGSMGAGVIFNAQNGMTRQQSHMMRFNVDNGVLYLIYGYFGDDSNFQGQGSVALDISPTNDTWQTIGVQVGTERYNILLNGDIIARDIDLVYQGGSVGLSTSGSQVAFDNVSVTAWDGVQPEIITQPETRPDNIQVNIDNDADIRLSDGFDTTNGGESLWLPFAGEWQFSEGAFVQQLAEGFDLGAGYNRSIGNATVRVELRHLAGQGGGLLFNMQAPDQKADSHMVRYVHDADFLTWGYYDVDGVYVGQGSANVDAPADNTHTLAVTIRESVYDIVLDSGLIASDVPIVATGDYHGLITAQSRVAFDNFTVSTDTARLTSTQADTDDNALNLNAVTGDWVFGEQILQRATETVDYIAGTGVAGETFRVSVAIDLSQAIDDAGAGIVFHMSGRENVAGGQMIRFSDGGDAIFWGRYDENGVFTGAGNVPLDLDWTQAHILTLIVRDTSYDVMVDETTIITDIPLATDFGWIGLLSYRGAVTFSDFKLSIGQG